MKSLEFAMSLIGWNCVFQQLKPSRNGATLASNTFSKLASHISIQANSIKSVTAAILVNPTCTGGLDPAPPRQNSVQLAAANSFHNFSYLYLYFNVKYVHKYELIICALIILQYVYLFVEFTVLLLQSFILFQSSFEYLLKRDERNCCKAY